ncbi:hypothetical protein CFP56_024179, partial [Quercus suber]
LNIPLSKSPKISTTSHGKKRKEKKKLICGNGSRKGLKICCGVTAILLITLIVVMVILYFTILTPKNPEITSQPVVLEHFEFWMILNGVQVFKKKATSDCTCDTSLFLGNISSHFDYKSSVKF